MAAPLDGIRILSFCRALSGPYASMLLSDLGAEVIKIEEPETGDFARFGSPFIDNVSSYFLSINRGKKSITLDLKKEKAREIIFKLVQKVDIVMENFAQALWIDWDSDTRKFAGIIPGLSMRPFPDSARTGPIPNVRPSI